eukprot:57917-Prymnesium_polylepis.1
MRRPGSSSGQQPSGVTVCVRCARDEASWQQPRAAAEWFHCMRVSSATSTAARYHPEVSRDRDSPRRSLPPSR